MDAAAVVEVVVGGVRWGGRGRSVVAAAARWRRRRTAGTPGVIAPSVRHAGQAAGASSRCETSQGRRC